ncbi:acyl transferase domain-containing protein, partial [Lactifluus volemus]
MFSSAAARRYVETVDDGDLLPSSYNVNFVGMVLPGGELTVRIRYTAMHDGNFVVGVTTINQHGGMVLEGTAEVTQLPTVYAFTGQGSQEQGMGMELYNSSPAARAIVRENPKTKTIHFGGIKGQAIRERYMEMTYDTIDRAGNIKTPVVRRYKPLLFATQFAQIALVIMSRAAFEDMRSKGFVQPDAAFAGHSLGEFSALASCAVERDEPSRSNYAMCATFDDATLREVVDTISNFRDCISTSRCGQQYVCAGEFVALQTLTN